jgi:murein DD-endopeptidase MepM/ murein hydrolase activator NlpD
MEPKPPPVRSSSADEDMVRPGTRYRPAGGPRGPLARSADARDSHGWGEPVLAPLDGEVVAASDGIPERERIHVVRELALVLWNGLTFRPTPEGLHRVVGNHVILRHDGVYSAYAHLTTGSVAVRVGQPVRVGDVLGRVGHTGNSTAPQSARAAACSTPPCRPSAR